MFRSTGILPPAIFVISTLLSTAAASQNQSILVQSTTSTENSGLYDHLLSAFEDRSGIKVNIVSVGTGQAIKNAQNCDADVLLVHSKSDEEKFVRDGYGVKRHALMYNDLVIVGPRHDPADVKNSNDAVAALQKILANKALFASRGDDSGTHKKEISLWTAAGIDPEIHSGAWYRSTGSGMGATLNAGIGMGAYVLTDRATWISFANKSDFEISFEGDPALHNQYGVIRVNPHNCPSSNHSQGQTFIDWLISNEGQTMIANFKLNGNQLFFPNAHRSSVRIPIDG